jgi:hypothetical protein
LLDDLVELSPEPHELLPLFGVCLGFNDRPLALLLELIPEL